MLDGIKKSLKECFLPRGRKLRRLRGGLAKGMLMEFDLRDQLQLYLGLYEREVRRSLLRLMPTCMTCVDIGGNEGYYTLAFLRSGAQRVVACGPASVVERLLRNAEFNGYRLNEYFSVERRSIGKGEGKKWLTVADLVRRLPRPILLKVDVEGGEFGALQSAEGYPFLAELCWVIETYSRELEMKCEYWLRSHGYKARVIRDAGWRALVPERRPLPHNRWLVAEPWEYE